MRHYDNQSFYVYDTLYMYDLKNMCIYIFFIIKIYICMCVYVMYARLKARDIIEKHI